MSVPPEERFAAMLKLAELPRNSSKVRIHHRCELSGRPKALLPQAEAVAYRAARAGEFRPGARHDQGELVRKDLRYGDQSIPISDLLTRIRNGQLRGMAKVKSPNSRLRVRLLDVLQAEGYIRGYAEVEIKDGLRELEIELKYHEGRPVIRELKRVSKPGRRVYVSVSDLMPYRQGLGVSIVSTPQGVMTDSTAREKNVGGEVLCHVF